MSFQPVLISSFDSGLTKNKKPYLLIDNAFQEIENAYSWRDRVKKREGIKLIGRLRRCLTSVTLTAQANGTSHTVTDIFADGNIDLRNPALPETPEPDAEIEPGGFTAVVGGLSFSDSLTATPAGSKDGVLAVSGNNSGTINYVTGELILNFDPAIGATNVVLTFCYFPALPAMGIDKRELAAVNVEQTVWFDTKYIYIYDTNDFSSPSTTTWSGGDSDFFWMANYRGSTPSSRLFFATNNTGPATNTNNRIRHTSDAATWTDFSPAVGGTQVTAEAVGQIAAGATPFVGVLGNTLIIPGSVTITVSNVATPATDPVVGFRDVLGTYPAGTLTGSPSTHSGTIDYNTGDITLNFSPTFTLLSNVTATYQHETTFLFQTKLIVAYYGRLLFLNPYEGATAGAATNIFNRCRFSQIGNPIQQDAWISTIPGKGGFIDAPTSEAIVSARFYKNVLIVFFERSTWQLRYVGEFGLPFLWERISSDFGSESTFSTLLFDDGVLAIGDKAIVSSGGNDVSRIDLDIPDTVFEFNNEEGGKLRVQGIRNFRKEVVYWTYVDSGTSKKFPNRTLLFNYRNGTYAVFRDNVTVFGELTTPTGVLWDLPLDWDSDRSWDESIPAEFPATISGNQQGWIHWYQFLDAETGADSISDMNEHESLSITSITLSATLPIEITVINHNLVGDEIIYITGLLFIDTDTSLAVGTDLNERFYQVTVVTDDTVTLTEWSFSSQIYVRTSHDNIGYTPDPANNDTYAGGGRVTLVQNINIITKDFNPFVAQGSQLKMAYTDFMTDATPNSAVSVDLFLNSSINQEVRGNILVGNTQTETAINQFGRVTNITQDDPGLVTAPDHGLKTNQTITFRDVGGMTQVNDPDFTVTFVSQNSFTIDEDTSGFTAYTSGGQWISSDHRFYVPGSRYAWHRFYATCFGQYISYRLFYDNNLMNTIDTHQSGFELNAIQLWLRRGGRIVL